MTHNNPADWNVFDEERTLPAFSGTYPVYTLGLLPHRDIELTLVKFDLITCATAGNRFARICLDTGVTVQTLALSTFPIPPSENYIITFAQGLQDAGHADSGAIVAPLPQRLRLGLNPCVQLHIVGGQPGDTLYNCVVRTNLYLKTPQ